MVTSKMLLTLVTRVASAVLTEVRVGVVPMVAAASSGVVISVLYSVRVVYSIL